MKEKREREKKKRGCVCVCVCVCLCLCEREGDHVEVREYCRIVIGDDERWALMEENCRSIQTKISSS